jgi:hypothetical protein
VVEEEESDRLKKRLKAFVRKVVEHNKTWVGIEMEKGLNREGSVYV